VLHAGLGVGYLRGRFTPPPSAGAAP